MLTRKDDVNVISLLEVLSYRAQYQSERQAYIFLQNGEAESASLTYGELDSLARQTAARLQFWQGERALLLYPSGLEFITAFLGCLYAGVVAVPVYPPRRNQKLSRLLSIVNDAQAKVALTTRAILAEIEKRGEQEPELTQLKWVATDTIKGNPQEFVTKSVTPESLAFLQYTSGSTGTPKGVMVTHGNIIHNQQLIHQAFGHSEDSIGVGWLPLFHDMGLIGHVIQPIYAGFTSILMPAVAFIQKPICWLKAISKYRASTSGGPNFAYDLCIKKVKQEQLVNFDLSSWDLAFSGGEPVRAETLEKFSQKFAECGFNYRAFYPCYGMAETTLFATGGDKNQLPVIQGAKAKELEQNLVVKSEISAKENRVFVGCGRPDTNTIVIIVNPESLTRSEKGQVGEIWVSGGSIASGYWNHIKVTQEIFQAYLKDTGEGPFLRTGDLGFLLGGELFVTGRLKDVIIIRGRNHYPQDIELSVEKSHGALRANSGAAFSIDVEEEERLVLVQELELIYVRQLNSDQVVEAINQAVSLEHELAIDTIVLLKPGSIPKTSSGKIQRSRCRQKFLDGSLQNVVFTKSVQKVATQIDPLRGKVEFRGQEAEGDWFERSLYLSQNSSILKDEACIPREKEERTNIMPFVSCLLPSKAKALVKEIKFSLLYFSSNEVEFTDCKYRLLLEGAKFADQNNFHAVWIPERHFHSFGGLYPEPAVLGSALAMVTEKIRIRPGSVVLPLQNPVRVAEQWSVVDNLSGGRVDISFARGWNPNDFVLSPENYINRTQIMFDGVKTVQKLWRGESVYLPNGNGEETEIRIYPLPKQPELPIWITCSGGKERFVEAGAMGANVLTALLFQPMEELASKIALYRDSRAKNGYDPNSGHVTIMLHTFVSSEIELVYSKVKQPFKEYLESSIALWRNNSQSLDQLTEFEREKLLAYAFERYFQTAALFGTPSSCLKMVNQLKEIGVDEIACLIDFGVDADLVLSNLDYLNQLRESASDISVEQTSQKVEPLVINPIEQKQWGAQVEVEQQDTTVALNNELPQSTDEIFTINPDKFLTELDIQADDSSIINGLQKTITQRIADYLNINPESVDLNKSFFALGVDSLKAIEMTETLQKHLRIPISDTLLLEYPTVFQLSRYLMEVHGLELRNYMPLEEESKFKMGNLERQADIDSSQGIETENNQQLDQSNLKNSQRIKGEL